MILRSADPKSPLIHKVYTQGDYVYIESPEKDDILYKIVKSFKYTWDWRAKRWGKIVGELSGPLPDRAAEIATKMIAAGLVVDIQDSIIHLVENQSYLPERKKWIVSGHGEFEGWLRVYWKYPEDLYDRAMSLDGARYDSQYKGVCVPPECYRMVEDFADYHECQIHPVAQSIIQQAKQAELNQVIVNLKSLPESKPQKKEALIPNQSGVSPEFLDYRYNEFGITTTTSLYDYQQAATNKMMPSRVGALFMEMGTGKTRVTIELIKKRQHRISNVIWLTPVSLKQTVYEEILKHTTITKSEIYIFDDKTATDIIPDAMIYIVGIESVAGSDRVALSLYSIAASHSFIIVDESTYIKNHKALRTKRIVDIAKDSVYRLILTGTPMSNGVQDLFAQMEFLSPSILGYSSFYSFAANHLEYSRDYPGLVIRAHNVDYLTSKIQPYTYQVTKDECLDLPDKIYDSRYFRLTQSQREVYELAVNEILSSVDEIDSYTIFQLFTALQQIVSGFWNYNGTVNEV